MKNILLLLCLLMAGNAFAKVIRVNNHEASNPQQNTYASLEDAYDNAQAGDTLYIEGSTVNYGSLTIAKKLTLIGPGYFLTENPRTQAQTQPAVVHQIAFNSGSEGSKLIGLSINNSGLSGITLSTSNIEIANCYFGNSNEVYININSIENISIHGCYFVSFPIRWWNLVTPPRHLYFANNIVLGEFSLQDNTTGTIVNNVFAHNTFNVGSSSVLDIHNNILLGTNASEVVLPAPQSSITHNVAALSQFGTANNNQANVAETEIFEGGESPDGKYRINENGPADGAGRDGVDIGAFGGPAPYRLSGIPAIPHIYQLSTDGYASEDGELDIQIKVQAN